MPQLCVNCSSEGSSDRGGSSDRSACRVDAAPLAPLAMASGTCCNRYGAAAAAWLGVSCIAMLRLKAGRARGTTRVSRTSRMAGRPNIQRACSTHRQCHIGVGSTPPPAHDHSPGPHTDWHPMQRKRTQTCRHTHPQTASLPHPLYSLLSPPTPSPSVSAPHLLVQQGPQGCLPPFHSPGRTG